MRRLTISMIAPFGIRPKGTLAARMLPLAQALTQRGHRIQIVAPATLNPEDAGGSEMLGGVLVVHSRLPRIRGPLSVLEQAGLLLKQAQAAEPDLVHLFKPKGFGGLAVLANGRIPLVVDSDDWEGWGGWNDVLPYPQSAKLLFDWQERDLPRRASAVTVVSRTLERQMRGLGLPSERIFYVPNGSTLVDFPESLSEKHQTATTPGRQASCVGHENARITPVHRGAVRYDELCIPFQTASEARQRSGGAGKRLLLYSRFWEFRVRDFIVELLALFRRYPQAGLRIIGKGEHGEEQELLDLAGRAGIGDRIAALGWVAPERIPGLLAECDIALVPMQNTLINRARGLAKLLELMQAGLAIAAQNVGQVSEYLGHEESALLVNADQPGALAGAALRLLEDDALRTALGQGAQQAARRFAWSTLALTVEQAYEAALGSRE